MTEPVSLRWLGMRDYEPTWRRMQALTDGRDANSRDQIWFLQHPPVFTLGMAASREHLLAPGDLPVVAIDRGAVERVLPLELMPQAVKALFKAG